VTVAFALGCMYVSDPVLLLHHLLIPTDLCSQISHQLQSGSPQKKEASQHLDSERGAEPRTKNEDHW
jgi:hypothetical protein